MKESELISKCIIKELNGNNWKSVFNTDITNFYGWSGSRRPHNIFNNENVKDKLLSEIAEEVKGTLPHYKWRIMEMMIEHIGLTKSRDIICTVLQKKEMTCSVKSWLEKYEFERMHGYENYYNKDFGEFDCYILIRNGKKKQNYSLKLRRS